MTSLDDYFGFCPECFNENPLTVHQPSLMNVGADQYLICGKHEVYWYWGRNVLSSWLYEPEQTHEENRALLSKWKQVEPVYPILDGQTDDRG